MFSLSLPVQTTPIARPFLSMIGEPDIPPTRLGPGDHSGPRNCAHDRRAIASSDKRNAEVSSPAFAMRRGGDMDYDNQLQNSYASENPNRLRSRTRRIEASHDRGRSCLRLS